MIFLRIMLFTEYSNIDDMKMIPEETTNIDRIKKDKPSDDISSEKFKYHLIPG